MSGIKVGVQWSLTNDNRYIVFGQDVSLYEMEHGLLECPDGGFKEKLIATNNDITYMKCLAQSPHVEHDGLFAVAQANGRVLLSSCLNRKNPVTGKEFAPRHPRQCTYLEWHRTEPSRLIQGLELNPRFKSDCCILVWDVNVNYELPASPEKMRTSFSESGAITKPYLEIGPSDSSLSFSWFSDNTTFVTGMSSKMLKIYDLREPSKPQLSSHTKAVYGVSVDSLYDYRFASFIDSQIVIWDRRSFDRPVLTLTEAKSSAVKIAWCPTRASRLACLIKDSPLKVYDIFHLPVMSDDVEPIVFECNFESSQQPIYSFSWHPRKENRMLTVNADRVVSEITMYDRIASAWAPSGHLTWSCGRKVMNCYIHDELSAQDERDISEIMYTRAIRGYGSYIGKERYNAELAESNTSLRNFWLWLDSAKNITNVNKKAGNSYSANKYVGVKYLISDVDSLRGEVSAADGTFFRVSKYQSNHRTQSLVSVGWHLDPIGLDNMLNRLEENGEIEKAAALALFNIRFRQSIDILHRGSAKIKDNSSLNAVAMALSGYTADYSSLWRETCILLRSQLPHPYLRAMFAFLLAESDDWLSVLNETELELSDRVGFACTYLNDKKLKEYLSYCTEEMVRTGNLDGIVLTGLSREGLDLLQAYVDRTGDIQTAAVTAVYTQTLSQDDRIEHWIESYRKLLDRWALWHERSQFDISLYSDQQSPRRPPTQVCITCNFCSKSVSNVQFSRKRVILSSNMSVLSSNKSKITSCSGCRKPLPRCALCLKHMGTPSGSLSQKLSNVKDSPVDKTSSVAMSEFNDWFTWCQTCRHGGHSSHITDWFTENTECPVSGCHCQCMTLDNTSQRSTSSTQQLKRLSIKDENS